MLIVSMRWYLKYSNGVNINFKYLIKLKASVSKTTLPGKTSLITAEHSRPQNPTPIFNRHSKYESTVQIG